MQIDHLNSDLHCQSRARCIHRHHLDPQDPRDPRAVPPLLLNAARDLQADVLVHAKDELRRVFSTLCQARYGTVIADRDGILTWRCALPADMTYLDDRGLRVGSDWRESLEGTNSIGTCLETGRALSVHQGEHFKTRHAQLSSAAAQVRAPQGEIAAVVSAIACNPQIANGSHLLALAAMIATARSIEERLFRAAYPDCWILLMHDETHRARRAFLALDSNLRVVEADYYAHLSLRNEKPAIEVGGAFNALFAGAESCRSPRALSEQAPSLRRKLDGVAWNYVLIAPDALAWQRNPWDSQYFRLCSSRSDVLATKSNESSKGGLSARAGQRVRDYIGSHLAYDMPLEDLAAVAAVSLSHFSREFKRSFGRSPHQYIVVKRIERAAQLITTTRLYFSDIALQVGFADQSHFCRTFRQVLNMTPREFRRTLPGLRVPRTGSSGPVAIRRSGASLNAWAR